MKTALEIYHENYWELSQVKVEAFIVLVNSIQQDAWKQGMTDAAELLDRTESAFSSDAVRISEAILSERDNRKTL